MLETEINPTLPLSVAGAPEAHDSGQSGGTLQGLPPALSGISEFLDTAFRTLCK